MPSQNTRRVKSRPNEVTTRGPHFQVYRTHNLALGEQWHWRFVAGNGQTMADGAEGYANRSNAMRAVDRLVNLIAGEIPVPIHVAA
jgi:uncharacterized protein YegP (UPF0339 family)